MMHGIRLNGAWRPEGLDDHDKAIDTEAAIIKLPCKLKRVLVVEYVLGGTVEAKTQAAGVATQTYYNRLKRAISALTPAVEESAA